MKSMLKYQAKALREEKIAASAEAILVIVASLVVMAILPSILYKYFYADANLLEQPKVMEYIPIVSFAVAAFYFLMTITANFIRNQQIKKLEAQMQEDDCCGHCCNDDMAELAELEKLAQEAISQTKKTTKSKRKSPAKKKTSKK